MAATAVAFPQLQFQPINLLQSDEMAFIPTKALQERDEEEQFVATSALREVADTLSEESPVEMDELMIADLSSLSSLTTGYHASGPSSGKPSLSYSIRAVDFDGNAIRIPRKRKLVTEPTHIAVGPVKLLDVPVHRLLDRISRQPACLTSTAVPAPSPAAASERTAEDNLWVDRYAPRRFTELLGDDRVHREALSWVKEWDRCVFGSSKRTSKKRLRDGSGKADDQVNNDPYHRPQEKILLLSGPPGLGKTTLAHLVARQAGYAAMEINASDARTGSVVDERIRPALESGFDFGFEGRDHNRPVLLIVDEIDGATGAGESASTFVHKLVQMTFDKPERKGQRQQSGGSKSRGILKRPIIAICNDLYASSLAKLRPIARILRFSRPPDALLVRRLREVCQTEGLRTDSRALSALVGRAKGDLRGCLNTLQFVKAQGGGDEITESIIDAATKRMKPEGDESLLGVLTDLFTPLPAKRLKDLGLGAEEDARYVARLARAIEASASTDKVAVGCFEHYMNLRRHDGTFKAHERAIQWLSSFDSMNATMRTENAFAAASYLAYMLVPFYPLFRARSNPKVERPKADWEAYLKYKEHEETIRSFSSAIPTSFGIGYKASIVLELGPLINRIISPQLRPVHSQVVRPVERAILSQAVDVMITLHLRFIQDRGQDGTLVYRVEPPVDNFATYEGKRPADIPSSRYGLRQLIASEIESSLGKQHSFASAKSTATTSVLETRKEELMDKVPTDFFGRPIAVPSDSGKGMPVAVPIQPYKVSFRYNEGNSAAVRRSVKLSSFL